MTTKSQHPILPKPSRWTHWLCQAAATLLASAALAASAADDETAQTDIRATQLRPGLWMLQGEGGNVTASIGDDGVLLVDDELAPMAPKLLAVLRELGGAAPRFVVNTHFHYDHTGGNAVFGRQATIIAATAVRQRLMSPQQLWGRQHDAQPREAWPTLTFDDVVSLHVNGDDVTVKHLAQGHTDGDAVVLFQRGRLASLGDLYFAGMYPIFHPEHGGSLKHLVEHLDWVLKQLPDDALIVPGHGPLATKADLARYHRMIVASIEIVRAGIAAGKPLAQLQADGLPAEWESFSHGYRTTAQWIAAIHQQLSAEKSR